MAVIETGDDVSIMPVIINHYENYTADITDEPSSEDMNMLREKPMTL